MPSDIDGLLKHLRADEHVCREECEYEIADLHVRWIAAVEALVKQQGDLQDSILVNDPRNDHDNSDHT